MSDKHPGDGSSGHGSTRDNIVPWISRVGAWQARLAARRVASAARSSLGLSTVPAPAVRHDMPPVSYEGQAMRWGLVPHEGSETGATTLEVELYREPCNEIGTTCLHELELLATLVRGGAGGARALLFHSSVRRGFSAGADLRELHEGLIAKVQGDGVLAKSGLLALSLIHI